MPFVLSQLAPSQQQCGQLQAFSALLPQPSHLPPWCKPHSTFQRSPIITFDMFPFGVGLGPIGPPLPFLGPMGAPPMFGPPGFGRRGRPRSLHGPPPIPLGPHPAMMGPLRGPSPGLRRGPSSMHSYRPPSFRGPPPAFARASSSRRPHSEFGSSRREDGTDRVGRSSRFDDRMVGPLGRGPSRDRDAISKFRRMFPSMRSAVPDPRPRRDLDPHSGFDMHPRFDRHRVSDMHPGFDRASIGSRPAGGYGTRRYNQPRCAVPGYEVVKPLKTGGMSTAINLVKSRRDGTLYVEKRIRCTGSREQRARAEIRALSRIGSYCRNLNPMVEKAFIEANTQIAIILAYCDKGTVHELVETHRRNRQTIDEELIFHVALGVGNALCFLHYGIPDAKGGDVRPIKKDWDRMCHLDLKPCNIFLMSSYGKHPRVVLGDFGCAVTARDILQGEESPFEQGCGTPEWYPPEGRKPPPLGSYGPKTDMWQLGASLHVMGLLIGRPERDTLASRTPLGRHYGRTANSIVHELTRDNASKRYSAATLVKTLRKRY